MRRFQVPGNRWLATVRVVTPKLFSGSQVVAQDLPCPDSFIVSTAAGTAQPPNFQLRTFLRQRHSGREKHSVAPHNRTRMSKPLNGPPPGNVHACLQVPLRRWSPRTDPQPSGSAKPGPVVVGNCKGRNGQTKDHDGYSKGSRKRFHCLPFAVRNLIPVRC